jgi:uncharacterized membrane protein
MNLPPLHPMLVHFPIVLILVSLLFEVVGRALDAAWWRNAAFALLIAGGLGAAAAVLTGGPAGDAAERQGVSERAVDRHEAAGDLTMWLAFAAIAVRALASRTGRMRSAVTLLGFVLHVGAAAAVGLAGYRGGHLVFDHGAAVRVNEKLVPSDGPPKTAEQETKDKD